MIANPNWLAAPIVIPLITAALGLSFVRWGQSRAATWQYWLTVIGSLANLAVSLPKGMGYASGRAPG